MNINKVGDKEETRDVTIDSSATEHVKCSSKVVDGNLEITLQIDGDYSVSEIESITINGVELTSDEYTYDVESKKITIKKDVLSKYKGKIIIKPLVEVDPTAYDKYLEFSDFDDENDTCFVSGKKYDEKTKVVMPKKLVLPETIEHEGKKYTITGIKDGGFQDCKFVKDSVFVCPSTLKRLGEEDTEIYGYAFSGVKNLKKVVLNDGLEYLGNCGTFENCYDLEEINFPSTLKYDRDIPDATFYDCVCLNTLVIDNQDIANFTEDSGSTFKHCNEIFIKDTIKLDEESYIAENFESAGTSERDGYNKFYKKSLYKYEPNEENKTCVITGLDESFSKSNVYIPTHIKGYLVEKIGDKVFQNNSDIYSVYLNKYVKEIGNEAFNGCSVQEIKLFDGVTKIGDYCFKKSELKEINIPSTLKIENLGKDAFDCDDLTTLYLENQEFVDNLDNPCQKLFANVLTLYISKQLKNPPTESYLIKTLGFVEDDEEEITNYSAWVNQPYTFWFYDWNMSCAVKNITPKFVGGECEIPSSFRGYNVTSIEGSVFEDYATSFTMKLNEGIESIGYHAFNNCTGLMQINIPTSVNNIVHEAFYGCSSLKTVILDNGTYSVSSDNCKYLFEYADTIYIKTDVTQPTTSEHYIFNNFTNQGESSEKSGYYKWIRNS